MNELERYELAIAEGTFVGPFEQFISTNVGISGNDGIVCTPSETIRKASANAKLEDQAKNAAKSINTKTDDTSASELANRLSIGKKIKPISKNQELSQWNAKYGKFSTDDLQKEQYRLSQLGGIDGELIKFVNGMVNKTNAKIKTAQEAIFKALDAKRNASSELANAEENAKLIAAELALQTAEKDKAILELIQAANEKEKQLAATTEEKKNAFKLDGLTEAQRIRNRRIKALLSQVIVVRNGYTLNPLTAQIEFLDNERIRRNTEDERRIAIDILIEDEPQTKREFDEYITTLQSEFDLLMQEKYPWFTRNATTTPKEKEDLKLGIEVERQQLKALQLRRRAKNQKSRENELARKADEINLKYAKLRDEEQQYIFEDTVNDDMIEEAEENLDLNNMTDIERVRKEINDLERKLGRKIVPHRDIIESTDSDFDIESQLNPDDILIRDTIETDSGLTEERQLELVELKESLESDEAGGLYITEKIAESKMRAAIDAVTNQLINLNNNNIKNNTG